MTRTAVIAIAVLALPAIARAQLNCDQLREAENAARQRLHDCTRRGGGCVEEFRVREETVAAAADCPATTPTPAPEPTSSSESIPTPYSTTTPPPQPTPASTPAPAASVAPPSEPEHRGDHGHRVSVTASLIGLLVDPTLVEVTAEFALSRKLGVALTGGYANGGDTVEDENTGQTDGDEIHLRIIEAGGSARYYLVGSYDHGMQVGGQARYFQLEAEGFSGGGDGSATGISAGPFIGYKKTARFGLTFDSQLGVHYSSWRTKRSGDNGSSVRYADDGLGFLLNLNLGWAF